MQLVPTVLQTIMVARPYTDFSQMLQLEKLDLVWVVILGDNHVEPVVLSAEAPSVFA